MQTPSTRIRLKGKTVHRTVDATQHSAALQCIFKHLILHQNLALIKNKVFWGTSYLEKLYIQLTICQLIHSGLV